MAKKIEEGTVDKMAALQEALKKIEKDYQVSSDKL